MTPFTVALLVSLVIIVVVAGITALLWTRRHSMRQLLIGIGICLVTVGLLITGVMNLIVNGIRSIQAWVSRTPMGVTMWIGVGILVVALIVLIVGFLTKPVTEEQAKEFRTQRSQARASQRRQDKQAVSAARKDAVSATPEGKAHAALKQRQAGQTDESYDDIEAILKSHGIE